MTPVEFKLFFNCTAPFPLTVTISADSNGTFSQQLPVGLCDVAFKKTGYFSVALSQLNCFSNLSLGTTTLLKRSSLIKIPAYFSKVQDAINNAAPGDTILLSRGIYYENIDMKGKSVHLTSKFLTSKDTADISHTILDGSKIKSVVVCSSGESNQTIISGLTIQNGNAVGDYPYYFGGGIRCINSAPTLEYLIIKNNYRGYGGGEICLLQCGPMTISHTRIVNNSAERDGGGIRRVTGSHSQCQ